MLASANGHATPVLLAWDGAIAGMITVADRPREAARDVMDLLRGHGLRHIVMLTGDHAGAASAVARAVGITTFRRSCCRTTRSTRFASSRRGMESWRWSATA